MRYASRTARRYARALFSLAEDEDVLEPTLDEVDRVADEIESEAELRAVLTNREVPLERRRAIIEAIFRAPDAGEAEPPISDLTFHFLQLLLRNRRLDLLGEIQSALADLRDERNGVVRARVTTAVPLLASELDMIVTKLKELSGAREVELEEIVTKTIIGGVIIHVGQRVIDASVRTYLESMRERLQRVKVTRFGGDTLLNLNYDAIRAAAASDSGTER